MSWGRMMGCGVGVGAAWLLAAPAARAGDVVELDAHVGTDVPVAVSGGLTARLPFGLRVATSLGALPGPYVDLINDVVQGIDPNYSEVEATLVRTALDTSLVWRTTVGYRPFLGLYVAFGYSLASLGGGLSGQDVVNAYLAEQGAPPRQGEARLALDLSATVHLAVVEVGWEQVLFDRLVLRGAVGYTGTFAANATATPDGSFRTEQGRAAAGELARQTEAYLEDTFTAYVHAPVVSVAVGYQLW